MCVKLPNVEYRLKRGTVYHPPQLYYDCLMAFKVITNGNIIRLNRIN